MTPVLNLGHGELAPREESLTRSLGGSVSLTFGRFSAASSRSFPGSSWGGGESAHAVRRASRSGGTPIAAACGTQLYTTLGWSAPAAGRGRFRKPLDAKQGKGTDRRSYATPCAIAWRSGPGPGARWLLSHTYRLRSLRRGRQWCVNKARASQQGDPGDRLLGAFFESSSRSR